MLPAKWIKQAVEACIRSARPLNVPRLHMEPEQTEEPFEQSPEAVARYFSSVRALDENQLASTGFSRRGYPQHARWCSARDLSWRNMPISRSAIRSAAGRAKSLTRGTAANALAGRPQCNAARRDGAL